MGKLGSMSDRVSCRWNPRGLQAVGGGHRGSAWTLGGRGSVGRRLVAVGSDGNALQRPGGHHERCGPPRCHAIDPLRQALRRRSRQGGRGVVQHQRLPADADPSGRLRPGLLRVSRASSRRCRQYMGDVQDQPAESCGKSATASSGSASRRARRPRSASSIRTTTRTSSMARASIRGRC